MTNCCVWLGVLKRPCPGQTYAAWPRDSFWFGEEKGHAKTEAALPPITEALHNSHKQLVAKLISPAPFLYTYFRSFNFVVFLSFLYAYVECFLIINVGKSCKKEPQFMG